MSQNMNRHYYLMLENAIIIVLQVERSERDPRMCLAFLAAMENFLKFRVPGG